MASNMSVVEAPCNPKTGKAILIHNVCYLCIALNSQLIDVLIWRAKKNLDMNSRPDCWTFGAANKRSVDRNVGCKAALRVLGTVIPMENDREAQLISHT